MFRVFKQQAEVTFSQSTRAFGAKQQNYTTQSLIFVRFTNIANNKANLLRELHIRIRSEKKREKPQIDNACVRICLLYMCVHSATENFTSVCILYIDRYNRKLYIYL